MNRDQISRIVRQVPSEQSNACRQPATAPGSTTTPRPQGANNLPRTSRAAVLTGKGRLELREFPMREITGDEMLVRVEGCGICATRIDSDNGFASQGLLRGI